MATDETPRGPDPQTTTAPQRSGKALAALITGIAAVVLVFLFFPVGVLLAIAGLVVGILGYKEAKRPEVSGGGLAVGGIVLSVIALILGVIAVLGLLQLAERTESDPLEDPEGFQQEVEEMIEEDELP